MAWDSNRPVAWQRLTRDWLLYVSIMAVVFFFIYRDRLSAGPFIGLLLSGPIFIFVGGVLAKFGYQRKTLRDLRTEGEARRAAASAAPAATSSAKRKPAPTRRTSTGPGRNGRSSSRPGKRR